MRFLCDLGHSLLLLPRCVIYYYSFLVPCSFSIFPLEIAHIHIRTRLHVQVIDLQNMPRERERERERGGRERGREIEVYVPPALRHGGNDNLARRRNNF